MELTNLVPPSVSTALSLGIFLFPFFDDFVGDCRYDEQADIV